MRIIVYLAWVIYQAGYFLGQTCNPVGAAQALIVTYNTADFVQSEQEGIIEHIVLSVATQRWAVEIFHFPTFS